MVALYVIQAANYIAPLITLPWLTRHLGAAAYGKLGFCTAFTSYFVLLTDYGFNLSATRAVAMQTRNPERQASIFWNTLAVKTLLATLGFAVLTALVLVFPPLRALRAMLGVSYLAVLGSALTPVWFYLATERQTMLGRIMVVVRLAAVPATVLTVTSAGDLLTAALINGLIPLLTGLICLAELAKRSVLGRPAVRLHDLFAALKDGWPLFLSNASTSLYTNTNTVLLGLLAGTTAVGYYAPAERVVQAAQSLLGPINQTAYPRVCRLMPADPAMAFAFIRRTLAVMSLAAGGLSLLLFLGAPEIVHLLYGPRFLSTAAVLRCLAFLPLVVGLSNVLGIQTMLPLGMNRLFSSILIVAGPVNIILLLALAGSLGAIGAATAVLTTEVGVTLVMALKLYRREVPIFHFRPAV